MRAMPGGVAFSWWYWPTGWGGHMREEFRDRIVGTADGVAELYLFDKKIDQPATREQKEFIEGIVATDYDGRHVQPRPRRRREMQRDPGVSSSWAAPMQNLHPAGGPWLRCHICTNPHASRNDTGTTRRLIGHPRRR
jgi:hypothetical protein